ncbi:MAG: DUF2085 domain-containing protein [Chloroflexi bacterium]|nr:DUF2085 domain-containing protein [Chloroflexota bacterium]MCY3580992.1 DUF2085 domain-containing protein [Chloroflexota bacterium]MCY3715445.1 DUF2085 domain-containing protein [Chloroflexota bacterium]MDE2651141.1 DUF2085 domain-containing protein [Chloroflexota bacterium]MXV92996.1 DUF2085 domain-containing protein [Chloroflexota bacterium]
MVLSASSNCGGIWLAMRGMARALRGVKRFARWILLCVARNWLRMALTILALYISLPWLAPTLAQLGMHSAADAIYTIYSPFCHQFAFRSVFVFGQQAFYPRATAGTGLASFEEFAAESAAFQEQYRYWASRFGAQDQLASATDLARFSAIQQLAARHFIGDASFGYKTSLCARDLAIYTLLFIGGLVYRRYRWRIRPLPLWLFVLAGLLPIALDGGSQLLSYPPFELWRPRESAPFLRIVTGGFFGLMCAWLGFPHLERSMHDIARQLEANPPDLPCHQDD